MNYSTGVALQRLVRRRQELQNEIKKLRTKIKQLPGKYPLPSDGQKIWITEKSGKRRWKGRFYFIESPLLKSETIDCCYDRPCFKHQKYHVVYRRDGKLYCCWFKMNWHAKNGGWEAA